MAEVSSLPLLPWICIRETLASNREVDPSLIYDILKMAPQIPDDLGENMIEMVALGCLERLYCSSGGSKNKLSLAVDCKIRFDPSESCESVLRFLYGETPNLRVAEPEHLKLDIHSFIVHKRASMPKCTLQQLKDSIVEGTSKDVATLKDISGLVCTNESETIPSNDGDCNALPQRHNVTLSNNREKGNSVPQTLEGGDKLSEKIPRNLNSSPSNRDGFGLGTEKVVGGIPESQYVLKSKKRKHHDSSAVTSGDEPCQNLNSNEVENNSMCPAEAQTFSAAPQEGTHHETPKSSGSPKHASQDESRKKVIANKPKDNMDDFCEAEKLSDSNGYGNEKTDVCPMKDRVLNSQFTLSHGSSSMADRTEQKVCVKCDGGGQLLVCNTRGCHVVVHEDCLGVSARFDNEGNFCCPMCLYSVSVSEYLESKKETSVARKRLVAFIDPNFEHQSKGPSEGLQTKEGDSRGIGEEDQVLAGQRCDNSTIPWKKREVVHMKCKHIERGAMQKETFDTGNDKLVTSVVSKKHKRKDENYTHLALSQMRRPRHPFTAAEEEMIKVGVSKFSNGNERNMPWKAILEFGADVFQAERCSTDIKDKWRNMCKRNPNLSELVTSCYVAHNLREE